MHLISFMHIKRKLDIIAGFVIKSHLGLPYFSKKKEKIFIDTTSFWFCHTTVISHILLKSAGNVIFKNFCLKEFINYMSTYCFSTVLALHYSIKQKIKLFSTFCTFNFNMTKFHRDFCCPNQKLSFLPFDSHACNVFASKIEIFRANWKCKLTNFFKYFNNQTFLKKSLYRNNLNKYNILLMGRNIQSGNPNLRIFRHIRL